MKSSQIVGENLKNIINSKGLRKIYIRKIAKVSPSQLDGYLSGKGMTLQVLDKLAHAIGVDPWELLKPAKVSDRVKPAPPEPTNEQILERVRSALQSQESRQKADRPGIPEESRLGRIMKRLEALSPNHPGLSAVEAALEGVESLEQERDESAPAHAESSQVSSPRRRED